MALEIGELVRDARGDDAMRDFHHAISRAFFVDGANIAEAGVVERFAAEAGVVQKLVRTAWRERRFRAAVDASIASSVERGVQGVPAYGFADGPIISGMMEPRAILRGLSAGPSP